MMTLKEAIESGRPFKRPRHDLWFVYEYGDIQAQDSGICFTISVPDMVFEDWQLKPEPKEPRRWRVHAGELHTLQGMSCHSAECDMKHTKLEEVVDWEGPWKEDEFEI